LDVWISPTSSIQDTASIQGCATPLTFRNAHVAGYVTAHINDANCTQGYLTAWNACTSQINQGQSILFAQQLIQTEEKGELRASELNYPTPGYASCVLPPLGCSSSVGSWIKHSTSHFQHIAAIKHA
jgi:hypothetical protein